jgi:hypothetical protein
VNWEPLRPPGKRREANSNPDRHLDLSILFNDSINNTDTIKAIFCSKEFSEFGDINVLPLIYDCTNLNEKGAS